MREIAEFRVPDWVLQTPFWLQWPVQATRTRPRVLPETRDEISDSERLHQSFDVAPHFLIGVAFEGKEERRRKVNDHDPCEAAWSPPESNRVVEDKSRVRSGSFGMLTTAERRKRQVETKS
jgi:hypothetical protein